MRAAVLVAALCLGPLACDASEPAAADAKTDAPQKAPNAKTDQPPGDACDDAHAERIREALQAQCAFTDASAPANLPTVDQPPKPANASAVEILLPASGNLQVAGRTFGPGAWSTGIAPELGRAWGRRGQQGRPKITLIIEAKNNRTRVAALLRELTKVGLTEAEVLLAAKETLPVPQPPDAALTKSIADELRDLPADQTAVTMAKRLQGLVGACEPAQKAFAAVSTAASDARCTMLSQGLAEAMVACGCPDEENEILSVLYVMTMDDSDGSQAVAVPVRLDDDQRLTGTAQDGMSITFWEDTVAALDLRKPVVLGTQK